MTEHIKFEERKKFVDNLREIVFRNPSDPQVPDEIKNRAFDYYSSILKKSILQHSFYDSVKEFLKENERYLNDKHLKRL